MSKIITGLLVAGVGSLIASFSLSDACSNEIITKITPFLGSLPGLALAWFARVRMGGVNSFGVRK